MSFIHLLFVLVITKVISIENCIEEKEGKCVKCDDHYVLEKDKCNQCDDLNCLHCFNSKPKNCYICSHEFTIIQRQCGRKCDNIEQCDICNEDYTKCLHCMHGCQVDINGECSCKSRVIVIIVCIIISVIIRVHLGIAPVVSSYPGQMYLLFHNPLKLALCPPTKSQFIFYLKCEKI